MVWEQFYGSWLPSKQRKEDKETWWWDEEVQESIRKKGLAKNRWDMQRAEGDETRGEERGDEG